MGGPYKERKRPDRDSAGVCSMHSCFVGVVRAFVLSASPIRFHSF